MVKKNGRKRISVKSHLRKVRGKKNKVRVKGYSKSR